MNKININIAFSNDEITEFDNIMSANGIVAKKTSYTIEADLETLVTLAEKGMLSNIQIDASILAGIFKTLVVGGHISITTALSQNCYKFYQDVLSIYTENKDNSIFETLIYNQITARLIIKHFEKIYNTEAPNKQKRSEMLYCWLEPLAKYILDLDCLPTDDVITFLQNCLSKHEKAYANIYVNEKVFMNVKNIL
jgi:hypothetical protein